MSLLKIVCALITESFTRPTILYTKKKYDGEQVIIEKRKAQKGMHVLITRSSNKEHERNVEITKNCEVEKILS